jgi:hypothetical protein
VLTRWYATNLPLCATTARDLRLRQHRKQCVGRITYRLSTRKFLSDPASALRLASAAAGGRMWRHAPTWCGHSPQIGARDLFVPGSGRQGPAHARGRKWATRFVALPTVNNTSCSGYQSPSRCLFRLTTGRRVMAGFPTCSADLYPSLHLRDFDTRYDLQQRCGSD